MKVFRVNRITGENFKGMKHFEIIANGNNVVARGENGTGKTTFFDAYIWSVKGKLSDAVLPKIVLNVLARMERHRLMAELSTQLKLNLIRESIP